MKKFDKSFIKLKIFNIISITRNNDYIVQVPKIIINDEEIYIENLSGCTDKLASFKNELTVLLSNDFVCETFQLQKNEKFYVARIINLSTKNRYVFNSIEEYFDVNNTGDPNTIKFMRNYNYSLSESPHALISGITGSGKTYCLGHMIFSSILNGSEVYICDVKSDIYKLREYIGYDKAANNKEDIITLIEEVIIIMKDREKYALEKERKRIGVKYSDLGLKPVILVIDELGALVSQFQNKKETDNFFSLIRSIAMLGRQNGVFLFLGMQNPDSQTIETKTRTQMNFKMVLGNSSNDTKYLIYKADDLKEIKMEIAEGFYSDITMIKPRIMYLPYFNFKFDVNNLEKLMSMK